MRGRVRPSVCRSVGMCEMLFRRMAVYQLLRFRIKNIIFTIFVYSVALIFIPFKFDFRVTQNILFRFDLNLIPSTVHSIVPTGVGAAISLREGVTTSAVDIAKVQEELVKQGVRIH